ncbi:hypothetical protein NH26_09325 [Flammeovirga pacifica]|uniref:OmpA-like domain-containing protein n=2 Tax=Flammeovirga pacifica TaxID=915059 RepID=A0A1S1Z034_FLAPC|nr:hypothetical protein NH26_09325 [Flammeovirga pacifica]
MVVININVMASGNKEYTLKGIYIDSDNGSTIEGVKVCIKNIKSGAKTTIYTDHEGQFVVTLEDESNYIVHGTKDLYFDQEEHNITTVGLEEQLVEVSFNISEVRFDTPYILSDLNFEVNHTYNVVEGDQHIDFLTELLSKNPTVSIRIRVHSDARGAESYNKLMTQERAEYIRKVLIDKNIVGKRISAEGVGEKELLNDCGNGVKCSGNKHLENRRIEIVLHKEIVTSRN